MVNSKSNAVSGDEAAIRISGLHKFYGKLEALKGVDMTVKRGSIFGLVGANGAGKSTLIKILVGSSNLSSGSVSVLGYNPFKDVSMVRANIGYMPQSPALYEDLSAGENISFFGAAHQIPDLKKRIDEVLAFTLLSERKNDPVYSFSGGMKQRVSLACALVHEPEVLFLDEPTSGIDPKLREAFWQHFRQLAERGKTIFISTHLMDEALLCDNLAIMREGIVLVSDTPRNIMLRGNTRIKIKRAGRDEEFTVTNYPEQLPLVLQRFRLDPEVTRLEVVEDTLETIVLKMINNSMPGQEREVHANV